MIKTYPIKLDKDLVLRYFGHKSGDIPKDILDEVDESIEKSYKLLDPKICYDKFNIKYDDKNKEIILCDGSIFKENYVIRNIKDADYIIMAIITLGKDIDREISQYFNNGDYMKGMVYDAIGSAALEHLSKSLWKDLMNEARGLGLGITKRLCPGDSKWSIKDQAIIFKNLDASSIGVSLNESYMMNPVKSLSMIYGIGKNIKTSLVDHDCDGCELLDCIYRHTIVRKHKINVEFMGQKKEIIAVDGENLFKVLVSNGINVPNACGGHHTCGKCKVKVNAGTEISEAESRYLEDTDIDMGMRLSCFVKVDRDLNVVVPDSNKGAVILIDENGFSINSFNPRVVKKVLNLTKPSLEDQRDDLERVRDAVGENVKIPLRLLNKLPDIMENNNYNITCAIRKDEIISAESATESDKIYGIAIDIGTTTIAAYLYNLKTGKKIDVYSTLNPQKAFGADVISRIHYTITEENGLYKIHRNIIDEINNIVGNFCKKNKLNSENIYEITLAGNTVMIHLVLNEPVKNIANSPYIPAFTSKIEAKAREVGIKINPEGYVITLPMVASYIGADIIAALLSSRMYEKDEISLLLDIGTNAEIVLGNKDRLVACSAAAGPAFEGAGITFGIGGVIGAIDHVDLAKRPIYTTIGNAEPHGICGSGVVDVIAELVKHGIVDTTGRILTTEEIAKDVDKDILERVTKYKDEAAFLLDEKNGVYITQKDIRQIQLAKGAIYAGVKILISEMGINVEDIKKVYFAGGFGNYISVESAITIGLIPKELKDRVTQIGNAAGTGAVMALLSDDELNTASSIKDKVKYIELSNIASFQQEFFNAMYF